MSIDKQTLQSEREVLAKDFDTISNQIKTAEIQIGTMKRNLNAIHGAMQQVDKLLIMVDDTNKKEKKDAALKVATS